MTASAPYLSFNSTFTPACMGPWLGSKEGAPLAIAGGKRQKPDKTEMQLVYYVGVARGTSILVDFGKHRKVLSHVLSGVLAHVPPHVCRYSLGYGRTVALFLLSEGYTYFSVADEALGRPRGFETLSQVQAAFLECLGGTSSAPSSIANSVETDTSMSSAGGPKSDGMRRRANTGSLDEGDPQLLRRPSIPRSRSASQLTALMSEAMESKFEEIVSKCRGRPLPKPKLEAYPDAPDAYRTSKKSVYEPDLLEDENLCVEDEASAGPREQTMSARESLMSEIADMLKEVDTPHGNVVRGERSEGGGLGDAEDEEDEHIPGMDLLMGMVGGDKWFSVAGSAAWEAPNRASQGLYSTARFSHPREIEGAQDQGVPVRPSSGILQPVTIFDDADGEQAAGGGAQDGSRVQKTSSMSGPAAEGSPVAGRARQRLRLTGSGRRAVPSTAMVRGATVSGRKVPPILRGALSSVFQRTSTGTRLNMVSRGELGTPRSPVHPGSLPTVAEALSPGRSPLSGEGSSDAPSGRLGPLLNSFIRRGEHEQGLGGAGSGSGRSWRLPTSISRVKSGKSDAPDH